MPFQFLETRMRSRTINIQNNPIHCSCETYDFLQAINNKYKFSFIILNLICHSPDKYKNIYVVNLNRATFECKKQYYNFSKEDACAGTCDCWSRPYDNSTIVNCANKKLLKAPELLSVQNSSKIELHLVYNQLTEFPDMQKPGYNKVELLDLSHNQIKEFNENILKFGIEVTIKYKFLFKSKAKYKF